MSNPEEFDALGNPFHVGDLIEMTRQHLRDRLDGPERHDTGVVVKRVGPRHVMVHRHGEPAPELFHVSIWQRAPEELKAIIAKTYS